MRRARDAPRTARARLVHRPQRSSNDAVGAGNDAVGFANDRVRVRHEFNPPGPNAATGPRQAGGSSAGHCWKTGLSRYHVAVVRASLIHWPTNSIASWVSSTFRQVPCMLAMSR